MARRAGILAGLEIAESLCDNGAAEDTVKVSQ
jgi:hypothetical protein